MAKTTGIATPDNGVIGGEEWCALHELGVPFIKARVDSGAKTSALHAFDIQVIEHDGAEMVEFEVHPIQRSRLTTARCRMPLFDRRTVKSSSGTREVRYVIRTELELGPHRRSIELTLTDRDAMGYRMLLGREAMSHGLLVDSSRSFVFGEPDANAVENCYQHRARPLSIRLFISSGLSRRALKVFTQEALKRSHTVEQIVLTEGQDGLQSIDWDHREGCQPVFIGIGNAVSTNDLLFFSRRLDGLMVCLNSPDALSRAGDALTLLERAEAMGCNIQRPFWRQAAESGELSIDSTPSLLVSLNTELRLDHPVRTAVHDPCSVPGSSRWMFQGFDPGDEMIGFFVCGRRIMTYPLKIENHEMIPASQYKSDAPETSKEERQPLLRILKLSGLDFYSAIAVRHKGTLRLLSISPDYIPALDYPRLGRRAAKMIIAQAEAKIR